MRNPGTLKSKLCFSLSLSVCFFIVSIGKYVAPICEWLGVFRGI
jgi:hypothetical protein